MSKKRILIVDDHAILRTGLVAALDRQPDLEVCGEASNANDAFRQVAEHAPDLVVVDVSLTTGMNGIELVKHLHAQHPQVRILVLSMHDEELYGERAFAAGAHGYVMKRAPVERLLQAIGKVLAGQRYASPELLERIADPTRRKADARTLLTDRELEVLELIGRGIGTRDIAQTLRLSVKTIETYRASLKHKLGLDTAPQLVRYAVTWVDAQAGSPEGQRSSTHQQSDGVTL